MANKETSRKLRRTLAVIGLDDTRHSPPEDGIPKAMRNARDAASVVVDRQGRTALVLDRGAVVRYIPMPRDGEGFVLATLEPELFSATYVEEITQDYPVAKAARLIVGYGMEIGSPNEVVDALATLVNLSAHERETMAKKNTKATTAATTKAAAKKATSTKATAKKGSKKAVAKEEDPVAAEVGSETSSGGSASGAAEKTERVSSASRFRELIMTGDLTDDEIFDAVAKEFPAAKRSYVAWYRNDLKKKGQNPPGPKASEKAETAAA